MSDIDGTWNIEIATPMGTQKMGLSLTADGDQLSGTSYGDAGELPIQNGTVDGDAIGFTVDISFPFPMSLKFDLTRDGDSLSGTSKAGSFPPSNVTGSRS